MHQSSTIRSRLKSNSGLTLVETMIAGVVLTIMALGFSTYMFNTAKMQKSVETKNSMLIFETSVHAAAIDAQALIKSGDNYYMQEQTFQNHQIEATQPLNQEGQAVQNLRNNYRSY